MKENTRSVIIYLIPVLMILGMLVFIPLLGKVVPGFLGEVFAKIGGIMWTPFGLEGSMAFLGLLAVFAVNAIRRKKEGDEFVSMEIPEHLALYTKGTHQNAKDS